MPRHHWEKLIWDKIVPMRDDPAHPSTAFAPDGGVAHSRGGHCQHRVGVRFLLETEHLYFAEQGSTVDPQYGRHFGTMPFVLGQQMLEVATLKSLNRLAERMAVSKFLHDGFFE
jgi:hypothetical protein